MDPFFTRKTPRGHPFSCFEGIRGHPFPETWELRGIRFPKMGIRFSKTPVLVGIKRNQLPLLKLKKATQRNVCFAHDAIGSRFALCSGAKISRILQGVTEMIVEQACTGRGR